MTLQADDLNLIVAVMFRVMAALMVMPVYGHRSVPAMAKIILGVAVSLLLVLSGGISAAVPAGLGAFFLGLITEVVIGLFMGLAGSVAFWALGMAGELVGMQMGFNFGGSLHLSFENSPAPTGQFYTILGTLIFLVIGGHRLTLMALANTFTIAPPFSLALNGLQAERMISLTASLFTGSIQLALPILGALMLAEMVLALLSRVLPQLNAWVFGMPLKVGVGVLALWLGLPALLVLVSNWLSKSPFYMQYVVK